MILLPQVKPLSYRLDMKLLLCIAIPLLAALIGFGEDRTRYSGVALEPPNPIKELCASLDKASLAASQFCRDAGFSEVGTGGSQPLVPDPLADLPQMPDPTAELDRWLGQTSAQAPQTTAATSAEAAYVPQMALTLPDIAVPTQRALPIYIAPPPSYMALIEDLDPAANLEAEALIAGQGHTSSSFANAPEPITQIFDHMRAANVAEAATLLPDGSADATAPAASQPEQTDPPPTDETIDANTGTVNAMGGTVTDGNGYVEAVFSPAAVSSQSLVEIAPVEFEGTLTIPGYRPVLDPFSLSVTRVSTGSAIETFNNSISVQRVDPQEDGDTITATTAEPAVLLLIHIPAEAQGDLDPRGNFLFVLNEETGEWVRVPLPYDPALGAYRAEISSTSIYSVQNMVGFASTTTIVLDPDHGGSDPGGRVSSPAAYATVEKHYNLATAQAVRALLEACGVTVILTREDDSTVSLSQRAAIINSYQPAASVTIAYNVARSTMSYTQTGSGPETWRVSTEANRALSQSLLAAVTEQTGLPSRGQKNAVTWAGQGLYVPINVNSSIPHTQLELAFMDNYTDRAIIDEQPQWFAEGIFNGLASFLGLENCSVIAPSPLRSKYQRVLGYPYWLADYYGYSGLGGDPVMLTIGNFVTQATDLNVASPGFNFVIERTYNSRDTYDGVRAFGPFWSSSLDAFIRFEVDESVDVKLPDGAVYTYMPTASGAYEPQEGVFDELYPAGRGAEFGASADEFVLVRMNGTRSYFAADTGKLVRIADRNGNAQHFRYTESGALYEIEDTEGRIYTITTDNLGQITAIEPPEGGKLEYTYENGSLTEVKDRLGHATRYEYTDNLLTAVIDALGNTVVRNFYDSEARVDYQINAQGGQTDYEYLESETRVTYPGGGVQIVKFDAEFRPVEVIGTAGFATKYVYENGRVSEIHLPGGGVILQEFDDQGNMIAQTDPDGITSQWSFDESGVVTREVDRDGTTIDYHRDANGNLVGTEASDGSSTTIEVNEKGQPVTITRADGRTIVMTYDENGNYRTITAPDGSVITYDYTVEGHLAAETDPLGNTTSYTTDLNGQITKIEYPGGATETFEYTATGKLARAVDEMGRVTLYEYNSMDLLTAKVDPMGGRTTYSYSPDGDLTETVDPLGRATRMTYRADGHLLTITNALGEVTTYTRDAEGRPLTITDAAGTTTYTYDVMGRTVKIENAAGRATEWTYNANGDITSMKTANGEVTTYIYDAQTGLLKRVEEPLGVIWQYEHNTMGETTAIVQPDGTRLEFELDAAGRVLVARDEAGNAVTNVYDAAGHLTDSTNQVSATTQFEYGPRGELVKTTSPMGAQTAFTYNAALELVRQQDALGGTVRFERDDLGRIIKSTDQLGFSTTYSFDAVSNLLTTTNALGNTWTTTYDALDRILTSTDPLGATTRNTWSAAGDLIRITEYNGAAVSYEYNSVHELTATVDALGYRRTLVRDVMGNIVEVIDEVGDRWLTTFDARNRAVVIDPPGGEIEALKYDVMDRIVSRTNGRGAEWKFDYTPTGLLESVVDPLGYTEQSATYDAAGQLLTRTDAAGHSVRFEYDLDGRVVTQIDQIGGKVEYTFDALGNVLAVKDQLGHLTSMQYNERSEMIAITNANGYRTEFTVNPIGQTVEILYPNGGVEITEFDAVGQVIRTVDRMGGETLLTYSLVGDLTSVTNANGHTTTYDYSLRHELVKTTSAMGFVRTVEYDGLSRIVNETDARGYATRYEWENGYLARVINALGGVTSYLRDEAANIIAVTTPGGSTFRSEFDLANRRTASVMPMGQREEYTYTPHDLLETRTDANGATWTNTYDPRGLLVQVENPLGNSEFYAYDATWHLTSMTNKRGFTTTYSLDNLGALIGVHDAENGDTKYQRNAMGEVIAITNANGFTRTVERDLMGRVLSRTDAEGAVTRFTYDPVGNTTSRLDARGFLTTYKYDLDERLQETSYPDGSKVFYNLDPNGNLLTVSDKNGSTQAAFDALNRIVTIETVGRQVNETILYTYTADSQIETITYPGSKTLRYEWNANQWLQTVIQPDQAEITYQHDPVGRVVQLDRANGSVTKITYSLIGEMLTTDSRTASGQLIIAFDYAYDANSNVVKSTEFRNDKVALARQLFYDRLDRLVQAQETSSHDQGHHSLTLFQYDAVGNLTNLTVTRPYHGSDVPSGKGPVTQIAFTYNKADCLTKAGDTTYICDQNGNRIREEGPTNSAINTLFGKTFGSAADTPVIPRGGFWVTEYVYGYENELLEEHGYPAPGKSNPHGGTASAPATPAADPWTGRAYLVNPTPSTKTVTSATLTMAELNYQGNSSGLPAAWKQQKISMDWSRTIYVQTEGYYSLDVTYNADVRIVVDGTEVYRGNATGQGTANAHAEVWLTPGAHTIQIHHENQQHPRGTLKATVTRLNGSNRGRPGEYRLVYSYDGMNRVIASSQWLWNNNGIVQENAPTITGFLHHGWTYDVLAEAPAGHIEKALYLYRDPTHIVSFDDLTSRQQYYTYFDRLDNVVAQVNKDANDGRWYEYSLYGTRTNSSVLFVPGSSGAHRMDYPDLPGNQYGWNSARHQRPGSTAYYGSRFYDAESMRFLTTDRFEGMLNQPLTQNAYIFGLASPATLRDYYGFFSINLGFAKVEINKTEHGFSGSGSVNLGFVKAEAKGSVENRDGLFRAEGEVQGAARVMGNTYELNAKGVVEASVSLKHGIFIDAAGRAAVKKNGKTIWDKSFGLSAGYRMPLPPRYSWDDKGKLTKQAPPRQSLQDQVNQRFDAGWEKTAQIAKEVKDLSPSLCGVNEGSGKNAFGRLKDATKCAKSAVKFLHGRTLKAVNYGKTTFTLLGQKVVTYTKEAPLGVTVKGYKQALPGLKNVSKVLGQIGPYFDAAAIGFQFLDDMSSGKSEREIGKNLAMGVTGAVVGGVVGGMAAGFCGGLTIFSGPGAVVAGAACGIVAGAAAEAATKWAVGHIYDFAADKIEEANKPEPVDGPILCTGVSCSAYG